MRWAPSAIHTPSAGVLRVHQVPDLGHCTGLIVPVLVILPKRMLRLQPRLRGKQRDGQGLEGVWSPAMAEFISNSAIFLPSALPTVDQ